MLIEENGQCAEVLDALRCPESLSPEGLEKEGRDSPYWRNEASLLRKRQLRATASWIGFRQLLRSFGGRSLAAIARRYRCAAPGRCALVNDISSFHY